MPRVGAVLVAAGSSKRAGPGVPKQFRMLGTTPLFIAAMDPLLPVCDEMVVVVPTDEVDRAESMLGAAGLLGASHDGRASVRVVPGGTRRQDSVGRGLDALSDDIEVVLIHDAARPFASRQLVERVMAAAAEHGAAIPVVPVSDSVKRVEGDVVVASLDRSVLRLSQTPQGFLRDVLLSAREEAGEAEVTDDAQCVEMSGHRVAVVAGDRANVKLTEEWDLEVARLRTAAETGLDADARVGTGSDWHRLVPGRRLVLCGVEIPFEKGLDGWSDADVATHALMDALLGAVAERDIGHLFPPGDTRFEGASSTGLLKSVVELLDSRGFSTGSVDVTIVAEAPRLSPFIDEMRGVIAGILGVDRGRVSVKATTTEGAGREGSGEVISATAMAVVRPVAPDESRG